MVQHCYKNIEGWWGDTDASLYARMVDRFNTGSHFVEIGSFKGRSSSCMAVEIINSNKDIRFDCVDTWSGSEEHQQDGVAEDSTVVAGDLFQKFLDNTKQFSEIIHPIRLPSQEAHTLYDEESLDFVFIDAAHDMRNVLKDICGWLPKVKRGGIIAGHDYGGGHIGVNNAVDLYFKNIIKTEIQTFEDCSCWLVYKNFDIPTGNEYIDIIRRGITLWSAK
tara:strand:+ start:54 stop:713 length:660 start_codon:yes stop_codon:yes gene_type:complete